MKLKAEQFCLGMVLGLLLIVFYIFIISRLDVSWQLWGFIF